jgi:ribosomal protein L11 methyltransferase
MLYPALDVDGVDPDLLLAAVDDFQPTAVEERGPDALTVFFATPALRDRSREAVARAFPGATLVSRQIDDQDWARRSQQSLGSVAVGRITIAPPWLAPRTFDQPLRQSPTPEDLTIVIEPSMGFGTGHHASTRLCLQALQTLDLADKLVLDVGTGSGVLAMAAALLGARRVIAIDVDRDAVNAARASLALNPQITSVSFAVMDIETMDGPRIFSPRVNVLTANLTGSLLARAAGILESRVLPGSTLIVSGLLTSERDDVLRAFRGSRLETATADDEWVCLVLRAQT